MTQASGWDLGSIDEGARAADRVPRGTDLGPGNRGIAVWGSDPRPPNAPGAVSPPLAESLAVCATTGDVHGHALAQIAECAR